MEPYHHDRNVSLKTCDKEESKGDDPVLEPSELLPDPLVRGRTKSKEAIASMNKNIGDAFKMKQSKMVSICSGRNHGRQRKR